MLAFGCLWGVSAVASGLAATPAQAPSPITVQPIPGDRRPLKIVGAQLSPDGATATITFQSEMGIFAFTLEPLPEKVTKVVLVVENHQFCEGLTYWPKQGPEVDLRHAEGVTLQKRPKDLAVEITGQALGSLKAGGKVQFVNQYR